MKCFIGIFVQAQTLKWGGVKSPITPLQKEIELSHAISNGMHFPTKITFSNKYVVQVHIPRATKIFKMEIQIGFFFLNLFPYSLVQKRIHFDFPSNLLIQRMKY